MIIEYTKESFNSSIQKDSMIIAYFYASWCGPCMNFKPIYEKISIEFDDIIFGKINIDENREIAIKYSISVIPTIIFFKNGEPIFSHIGALSEKDLIEKTNKLKE